MRPMPTLARQFAPFLQKSAANSILPNGPMWASAPTAKYASAFEFVEDFEDFYRTTVVCRSLRKLGVF